MNRHNWKTLYRRMRKGRNANDNRGYAQSAMVDHGGTYWTISLYEDKGLHLVPSIIRDRAPSARIADTLKWVRRYRLEARTHKRNGSYYEPHARTSIAAALGCLNDCRDIRLYGSAFHHFI
jgi:hypothetical protein